MTTNEFRALLSREAIEEAEQQFREAKTALIEREQEAAFFRERLEDAWNAPQLHKTLNTVDGLLWAESVEGVRQAPFCSACLDKERLCRLEQLSNNAGPAGWWDATCNQNQEENS